MLPSKSFGKLRDICFVILLCALSSSCAVLKWGIPDELESPITKPRARAVSPPEKDVLQAEKTSPATLPTGPIEVTVEDAILLTLENNRSLSVQRFNPSISRTFEDQQRAVFDPLLTGDLSGSYVKGKSSRTTGGLTDFYSDRTSADIGVSQFFPTGTTAGVILSTDRSRSSPFGDLYASRAGLSVTQSLLKGAGLDVNLASLRQARIDTLTSEYQLRGFAESLMGTVEQTYWDYALAQRQIEIVTTSMGLAEQQLKETEERINIGRLAEIELAASQAEVALRKQDLITSLSTLETTRLRFLRLLNAPGAEFWKRDINLKDPPIIPDVALDDVERHVELALRMRPDLNQARLDVQRGNLEIVKTRNGLLPKMDLFIILGKTGYADSFGGSLRYLDGNGYDLTAGIRASFPPFNRDAEARYRRSTLSRSQVGESLENLSQLIQVDVRSAYVVVNRSKDSVAATEATRKLQEEKVRAETEKFRVGRSTTLLVAQAQRDLEASQISEITAVVNYLKALVDLYRLEGSLLERRGIKAPGREPVTEPVQ